ncbi:MAG: O-antigen ligase family protein [Erysipelotrichaceae bacterium]|nr:O-antigen ligase family protein [Erysipelotrichaceae bacterium]
MEEKVLSTKIKRYRTAAFAVFIFVVLFSLLIGTNTAFYSFSDFRSFNLYELIGGSVILLIAATLFFVFKYVKGKEVFDLWSKIVPFVFVFLLLVTYELFRPVTHYYEVTTNERVTYFFTYNLLQDVRLMNIIFLFNALISSFFIFVLFPKQKHAGTLLKIFLHIALTIILLLLIYSFIFEFNSYLQFFKTASFEYMYATKSLFLHRNSFAAILLFGILICTVLDINKSHFGYKIAIFVILVSVFFTCSKFVIVISAIVALLHFLGAIIQSFKKNWFPTLLVLISIGILATWAFATYYILEGDLPIDGILSSLVDVIFAPTLDNSWTTRFNLWSITLSTLDTPLSIIFGNGIHSFSGILMTATGELGGQYLGISAVHNGFLEIIVKYGVIGTLSFVTGIVVLFIQVFKRRSKNKWLVANFFLILGAMSAYAMIESVILFEPNVKSFLVYCITFLPLLTFQNCRKTPNSTVPARLFSDK